MKIPILKDNSPRALTVNGSGKLDFSFDGRDSVSFIIRRWHFIMSRCQLPLCGHWTVKRLTAEKKPKRVIGPLKNGGPIMYVLLEDGPNIYQTTRIYRFKYQRHLDVLKVLCLSENTISKCTYFSWFLF